MWRIAAALIAAASVGTVAGVASGAAGPGTYPFTDCQGPAGTPVSFTAVKENLPDAEGGTSSAGLAYRLTDGSGRVFVVQQFGDGTIAPGIPDRNTTVTCQVSLPDGTFTFTGFLVPRG
jgi:hypothetical protein